MLKAFWKPFLIDHLGATFQCKLLQDVEVNNNSEEVKEEAEDQESDHAIMWYLEYLNCKINSFFINPLIQFSPNPMIEITIDWN